MRGTNKSRRQLRAEGYKRVSKKSHRIKSQDEKCSQGNHDMEYSQTLGVVGGTCRNCDYSTI